jgi:DHA1 family bicyclomycin/chloramphenicol resistance-like MFS transporter
MDRKTEFKYLFLIIFIFIAACIETDIYLPAFPDMMKAFSVSEGAIQSLLTWNFVGICVSGPLYGPLSDAFGRKKPLMIALGMFLVGSFITLFSNDLDQMLIGRVLQGFGSGGCFTLGTAILFDAFQKEKAISAINNLNTIVPLIMAGAPMLGGYLNQTFGFRSNFLAIALFVILSFIITLFFFNETLSKEKRTPFQAKAVAKDFKQACCHLGFWQITIVISAIFGAYIAFLSGTSVLFMVEFGMSKSVFPFIQAAILGGWVAGSLLLNRTIAKWGNAKVKKAGTLFCIIGGITVALVALVAPRNPYLLTAGMTLYAFGANWVIGLYFPEGMELLPHMKGIAASFLTSARLLIAALIVGLSSALYNATVYPLAAIVFGTILVILPTLIWYEKRRAREPAPEPTDSSTSIIH